MLHRGALVVDDAVGGDDGDDVGRILGQRPEAGLAPGHVLEGGAGERRHEGGQLFLLGTEQAADLTVDDVEARRRTALDLDGRAQRRAGTREQEALARLARECLLGDDRSARRHRPTDERATEVVDRRPAPIPVGVAVDQLDDVAAFAAQQRESGLPYRFPYALGRRGRRHPTPHLEQGGEAVGERQGLGAGGVGSATDRAQQVFQRLLGVRQVGRRAGPAAQDAELAPGPQGQGALVAGALGGGDGEAAVEVTQGHAVVTSLGCDQGPLS